jgi:hypothetical protein
MPVRLYEREEQDTLKKQRLEDYHAMRPLRRPRDDAMFGFQYRWLRFFHTVIGFHRV